MYERLKVSGGGGEGEVRSHMDGPENRFQRRSGLISSDSRVLVGSCYDSLVTPNPGFRSSDSVKNEPE